MPPQMQPMASHGPQQPALMASHSPAQMQPMSSHGGSPLQAAMRRPQPAAPTGPFAGNAQGSVMGPDPGPDAGMAQGLSPELLAMLQGPQQELGNFSQAPNIPQMQSGRNPQLPQGGNRFAALMRAILPGV